MANNPELSLSPEEMRALGQQVLEKIISHFTDNPGNAVAQPTDPAMLGDWLKEPIPLQETPFAEVLQELEEKALSSMTHLDHPRCFAFVPSPNNYVSALAEFIASAYNIFAGAWLGPSGIAAIEMKSIDWLEQMFGMPEGSGGLFVSGGSMANMTALAVARHEKLSNNPTNASVYFSDQTHSSIPKGLKILGFQPYQIRKIPSDEHFMLSVEQLAETIDRDRRRGLVPFCVVANAGTTNTGAVDPISKLVEFCEQEGLWLHIDGAYGGASILTEQGKKLLQGIAQADSITIDPHKWMFQPYEIGCVLVRSAKDLKEAFKVSAEYLEVFEKNQEQANYCDYGVQLTRGFRALKFWMSFKTFGLENFRAAMEKGIRNAEYAQELLERESGWEIVTPAQLGVINFRYRSDTPLPEGFHARLSREIILDGFAMITPTRLKGRDVLRLCTINPRTTEEDLAQTIDTAGKLARKLAGSGHAS